MIEIAFCGQIPFPIIAPYLALYSRLKRTARQADSIKRQVIMTACDPDSAVVGDRGVHLIRVRDGVYSENREGL